MLNIDYELCEIDGEIKKLDELKKIWDEKSTDTNRR